ncbi:hypothetical protein [Streptomyces sp. NPDC023838]|uniref:hypothetical protein n=1 Tax=Streptomyces sp. NPDC023838 TaxID=3154325 RepID=UPI0033FC60CA
MDASQQAQARAGYVAPGSPQNRLGRRRAPLMPGPALPDWNLDGGMLSIFVNINLDAIGVPPETMNNRCRNSRTKPIVGVRRRGIVADSGSDAGTQRSPLRGVLAPVVLTGVRGVRDSPRLGQPGGRWLEPCCR